MVHGIQDLPGWLVQIPYWTRKDEPQGSWLSVGLQNHSCTFQTRRKLFHKINPQCQIKLFPGGFTHTGQHLNGSSNKSHAFKNNHFALNVLNTGLQHPNLQSVSSWAFHPMSERLRFKPWCHPFLYFSLWPGKADTILLTKAETAQASRSPRHPLPSLLFLRRSFFTLALCPTSRHSDSCTMLTRPVAPGLGQTRRKTSVHQGYHRQI